MSSDHTEEESRTLRVGYYLVAYLDVLGQSDELRKLQRLPQTEAERIAVLDTLRNTVGAIRNVRGSFETFFAALKPDPDRLAAVPEAHREDYRRLFGVRPAFRGFSDSIVITVPLAGEDDVAVVAALTAVQRALIAVAGTSLNLLANGGVSLRGGVDVGLGLEAFDDEYYGTALLDAYQLESKVADYPRVLVGNGLLNYLAAMERGPFSSERLEALAQQIVQKCRQMFVIDPADARHALDPLSAIGEKDAPHYKELAELGPAVLRAVQDRRQTFGAAKNKKLARRYDRLARHLAASPNAALLGESETVERWRTLTAGPASELRFGTPGEWEAFDERNARFLEGFARLEKAMNAAFVRETGTLPKADAVVFFLGRQCIDDFLEILVLAGNAEGYGAQKLLRTMFERVVLVKYLAEHPEEVDAFLDHFHVTRLAQLVALQRFVPARSIPTDLADEVRRRYEEVKGRYATPEGSEVSHHGIGTRWTGMAVEDMAEQVGLGSFVPDAYHEPMLQSQPSAQALIRRMDAGSDGESMDFGDHLDRSLADQVLACAHALILTVLDVQMRHFKLPAEPFSSLLDDWRSAWGGADSREKSKT